MAVTVLEQAPNLGALYARAAVTARGRGGDLPDTHLARKDVRVDPAHLADYARVCRLPLGDVLPATYPHMLTFPLQMALMSDRAFPLALPGLVHVRNRIDVVRAIGSGEPLDLEVWAENFATHRSGAAGDLRAPVRWVATRSAQTSRSSASPTPIGRSCSMTLRTCTSPGSASGNDRSVISATCSGNVSTCG